MNYYQILQISPQANMRQISAALEKLRKLDKTGHYASTIDTMEAVLTNPDKRAAYDAAQGLEVLGLKPVSAKKVRAAKEEIEASAYFEAAEEDAHHHIYEPVHIHASSAPHSHSAGYDDMFVDIESHYRDSVNDVGAAAGRDVMDEIAAKSVMAPHNQRKLKSRSSSISFKMIFMLVFAAMLVLGGFVFSKPLLETLHGREQVKSAMAALDRAQQDVLNATMANMGVFPDKMNVSSAGQPYEIIVNGTSTPKTITLTFTSQAASPLIGQSLVRKFIEDRPNMTFWQCQPSGNFPADFKPDTCL